MEPAGSKNSAWANPKNFFVFSWASHILMHGKYGGYDPVHGWKYVALWGHSFTYPT